MGDRTEPPRPKVSISTPSSREDGDHYGAVELPRLSPLPCVSCGSHPALRGVPSARMRMRGNAKKSSQATPS
jgi:hypothetical protein